MKFARLSLMVLAAVVALPVFADVTEDAIKLTAAGVGEEVVVAWAERQDAGNISAQDIIRMKDGKVPDRAIATLIRSGSSRSAAAPKLLTRDDRGQLVERDAQPAAPAIQTVPAVQRESVQYVQPTTY